LFSTEKKGEENLVVEERKKENLTMIKDKRKEKK
jgi:hypothetical protein